MVTYVKAAFFPFPTDSPTEETRRHISWSDSMKYLGINFILNERLKVDICPFLCKFYASVNAVITHSKYINEDVKLRLFESFSLPLLTYGLNVIHLSAAQLNKLNIS